MRLLPLPLLGVLLLVLLALPVTASADKLYKWTDSKGVVHYTDSPPPDDHAYESREIQVPPAPPPQAPADGSDPAAAAPVEGEPGQPVVSENCRRVSANVETMEANETVRMDLDGDGAPEALTPEQREQQLEIARRQVTVYCNVAPVDADGDGTPDADADAGADTANGGDGT